MVAILAGFVRDREGPASQKQNENDHCASLHREVIPLGRTTASYKLQAHIGAGHFIGS